MLYRCILLLAVCILVVGVTFNREYLKNKSTFPVTSRQKNLQIKQQTLEIPRKVSVVINGPNIPTVKLQTKQTKTACPFTPPSSGNGAKGGGWAYTDDVIATQHVTFDSGVVAVLSRVLYDQSVTDIGAGVGQLGVALKQIKANVKWRGFDGGHNIQDYEGKIVNPRGSQPGQYVVPRVCWIDATNRAQMSLIGQTDWVVSIEVGEHIEKASEQTFLDNLATVARRGIILSWAVPGQGGYGHVNEQSNAYVIQQLAQRGFTHDATLSKELRQSVQKLHWLKNTLLVFHKLKTRSITFFSYGDNRFRNSVKRITKEATNLDVFDKVYAFGPEDVSERFKKSVSVAWNAKRGGGYWTWKIYFLHKLIHEVAWGDIIVYIDSGSHVNKHGQKRFIEYINILDTDPDDSGCLAFQFSKLTDEMFTTKQVMQAFNVGVNVKKNKHLEGAPKIFKKTNTSVHLLDNVMQVLLSDPNLITDKYGSLQAPEFKESRHDQSMLSVASHKWGCSYVLVEEESWKSNFLQLIDKPFLNMRLGDTLQSPMLKPDSIDNVPFYEPSPGPVKLKVQDKAAHATGQAGQVKWVDDIFKGRRNLFVVESGGYDGETASNSLFFELARNWTCLMVEPNPGNVEKILALKRNCYVVPTGISTSGSVQMLDFKMAGPLSGFVSTYSEGMKKRVAREINEKQPWMTKQAGNGAIIPVKAFPFKQIIAVAKTNVVDYWSLDTEGSEPDILKAIDFKSIKVGVMTVEHNSENEKRTAVFDVLNKNGFCRMLMDQLDDMFINIEYFCQNNMPLPSQCKQYSNLCFKKPSNKRINVVYVNEHDKNWWPVDNGVTMNVMAQFCPTPCSFHRPHDYKLSDADGAVWMTTHGVSTDVRQLAHQTFYGFSLESSVNYPSQKSDKLLQFFNGGIHTHQLNTKLPMTYASIMPLYGQKYDVWYTPLHKKRTDAQAIYIQNNCNTASGRDIYIKKLMTTASVHAVGACLRNHKFTHSEWVDEGRVSSSKLELLSQYKFCISAENSDEDYYLTERYFHSLASGCIPIVIGGGSTSKSMAPCNIEKGEKCVIYTKDWSNPAELGTFLKYLDTNATAYNEYFLWRQQKSNSVLDHLLAYSYATWPCRVCQDIAGVNSSIQEYTKMAKKIIKTLACTPEHKKHYDFREYKECRLQERKQIIHIIIPFRDRHSHFDQWLSTWTARKQTADVKIYVIEQFNDKMFRRGWLTNIGVTLSMREKENVDCIIQQDVDLMPDQNVDYQNCQQPTHLAASIECAAWDHYYDGYVGGVFMATPQTWLHFNGMTNNDRHGWGGEDDDLYWRLKNSKTSFTRVPKNQGKFYCANMAEHTERKKDNKKYNIFLQQLGRMSRGSSEWKNDGLNNVQFTIVNKTDMDSGVTWVQVTDAMTVGTMTN